MNYLLTRLGGNHQSDVSALDLAGLIECAIFGDRFLELVKKLIAELGMKWDALAELETDGHLDLVAAFQELYSLIDFRVEVASVDLRGHSDFFDFDYLLVLSGFLFSLGLLEAVLAVIHDFAYRRICRGRNFNKIKLFLVRNLLRFL